MERLILLIFLSFTQQILLSVLQNNLNILLTIIVAQNKEHSHIS